MTQLSLWGIGPTLLLTGAVYFLIAMLFTNMYPDRFNIPYVPRLLAVAYAIKLLIGGGLLYIQALRTFWQRHKKGYLVTTGPFALCRNPIYASIILLIVPALALLLNSWFALTTSIVMYIIFKLLIRTEYRHLQSRFGQEYLDYAKKVNEILPFPTQWIKKYI